MPAIVIPAPANQREVRPFVKDKGMISFANFQVEPRCAALLGLFCEAFEEHLADAAALRAAADGEKQQFRQFLEVKANEKVLLVDDILRSGKNLMELKALVESYGATVVGLAVIVYQPTPNTADFGDLPVFYLAKLDATYLPPDNSAGIRPGEPVQAVRI